MSSAAVGRRGEELAAEKYRQMGYVILANNFRTRQGEIDLVAEKDGLLVFIEVKTRTGNALARPGAYVGPAKQRRIALAAGEYLQQWQGEEPFCRFDVAEVLLEDDCALVHCIQNAFTL